MDILDLMKADHDEAADLIDQLEDLAESNDKDDAAKASAMVAKLTTTIFLHAKSEEVALYEACKGATTKVRDFALEGYHEHVLLLSMLDKLSTLTPGEDGEFKACLSVCNELFENHARVEEEKIAFPKLRRAFNAHRREEMAQSMLAEKRRLQQGQPERELGDEAAH